MAKFIELCAKRPKHKDLIIVFYNTPFGVQSLEKTKKDLIRRGYEIVSTTEKDKVGAERQK